MWNANARGSFFGLTPHHTRAHMARAVLEGTVYELYAISLTLETVVGEPRQIMQLVILPGLACGRQILADVFQSPVAIPQEQDSRTLAAVVMGMKSLGMIKKIDVIKEHLKKPQPASQIRPPMTSINHWCQSMFSSAAICSRNTMQSPTFSISTVTLTNYKKERVLPCSF